MKIISMLSQKGGSGKTTIAVHLAVAALRNSFKILIIDTDPQKSVESWFLSRESDEPQLVVASASNIASIVDVAKDDDIDYIFIDTMPHTSSASSVVANISDLVLIPCQPTPFDISAIQNSINITKARNKNTLIVINRAPNRAPEILEARKVLSKYNTNIYDKEIMDRRVYFRAVTQGLSVNEFEPRGRAAIEIIDLWEYIKGIII